MSGRLVTPGRTLRERAARAVADPRLQRALRNLDVRLRTAREAQAALPGARERAARIRRETLADLDGHLVRLQESLEARGVRVHRVQDPAAARELVVDLVRAAGGGPVVKSKSMATEEIDLDAALEAEGIRVVESDLGEYIVQLAGERPSHMITPAIHKTLEEIRDVLSAEAGHQLPLEHEALAAWVRERMRRELLAARVGITGVNFAVAETGTLVLVTNEGNGRYCVTWPRVHVAVMPVEKVVPRFEDLGVLLPLLTRSATGQPLSNYVSLVEGPRRPGEVDGPEEVHLVVLDHGRRALLGTPYQDVLACIRCGACLNVCPVYRHVGGHAYDAAYTGPLGAVLTPLLDRGTTGADLPWASTLCGACTEACPVGIPLADLLVRLRADGGGRRTPVGVPRAPAATEVGARPGDGYRSRASCAPLPPNRARSPRGTALGAWAWLWSSPVGYRASTAAARAAARLAGRGRWVRRLPGVPWTGRDVPLPAARAFRDGWRERREPQ